MCKLFFMLFAFSFPFVACAEHPNCDGVESWPASMAFVHLKNDNYFKSEEIDFEKTKVNLLASQEIKDNLYKQVHLVSFYKKNGVEIEVVSVNEASAEECSMGPVSIFVISKRLGHL